MPVVNTAVAISKSFNCLYHDLCHVNEDGAFGSVVCHSGSHFMPGMVVLQQDAAWSYIDIL